MRSKYFSFFVISLFVLLGTYLFYLQIIRGRYFRSLSESNAVRIIPQEGARGRILDRNGDILVDNYLSFDVFMLSQGAKDKNMLFARVAGILGVDEKSLRKKYKLNYFAPFAPVKIAENIERGKAIKLEMYSQDLPGIVVRMTPKRHYPNEALSCQLIGYLGEIDYWRLTKLQDYGYKTKDVVGYGGVEERYDYYLRPQEGGLQIEVDHQGRFMRTIGYRYPQNGKDVQLTLDARLQKIAEENLTQNGAVVIMDPQTGEILVMASFPGYDPTLFFDKDNTRLQKILNDPDAPLFNRCISGTYAPGSIFKLVTALAGLNTGSFSPETTHVCTGGIRVGRRTFRCWDTHGTQNLFQAVAHSCDVYFYRTGLAAGPQTIYDYALKLGLAKSTGIDVPLEVAGSIPSPLSRKIAKKEGWYEGDTANMSIGQGQVLTTPLQIARLMAVFANDGYLVTPYVVKAIDGKDVSTNRRRFVAVGADRDWIETLHRSLRGPVHDEKGTAKNLDFEEVAVAGKTGTAEAPPGQPHSWFAGFFPFEEPRYVICVFLEHGGSSHYATAVVQKIIEQMIEKEML